MTPLDLRSELKHPYRSGRIRVIFCFALLAWLSTCQLQAQTNYGSIMGYVYDLTTKKAIPFANITVNFEGQQVTGNVTDLQGFFSIPRIKSDTNYVIIASTAKHRTMNMRCSVMSSKTTHVEFSLPLKLDTITPIIGRSNNSPFIFEPFSSAILDRGRSKAKPQGCVQDNDGVVGSIRGTRYAVKKNMIVEPVEPIPAILNGVPARMENDEALPKAVSPQ